MSDSAKEPTPTNIRAARKSVGLSQQAAAELVHLSRRAWQAYEDGASAIKIGIWELFLFKTGQLWFRPTPQGSRAKRNHPGRAENLKPFTAQRKQE